MARRACPSTPRKRVIFRRYRKLKNGRVLDAHAYGLKAWPIYLD